MSELKKKQRARNGHRLFVRNIHGIIKDIFNKNRENLAEISVADRVKLQSLQRSLEEQSKDIEELDKFVLEALTADDNIEKEISEKCDFSNLLREAICLAAAACLDAKAESQKSDTATGSSSFVGSGAKPKKINLPKLQLPIFDGNPLEWITFWDSFQSTIGSDEDLNDVDKFKYLRSYLSGAAYAVIDGLSISNENYKEAVELLLSRFGSKQVIESSFMNTLRKLPAVKSLDDIKSLRLLYDKTEAVVRSLKGIRTEPGSYGTFITPLLMAKLPEELRILIARSLDSREDTWKLEEVLPLFGKEVQLREKCAVVNPTPTGSYGRKTPQKDFTSTSRYQQPATASALHTSHENRGYGKGGIKCFFCNGDHVASKCVSITNPEMRMKILKEKGRCFLCLKGGHLAASCPSGNKCFRCGRRHHIALCDAPLSEPSRRTCPQNTVTKEVPKSTANMFLDHDHTTLLQTAKAKVSCPVNENVSANIRVLFDSGSSKTFVSERLSDHLKLPVIGKEQQLIKVFGQQEAQFREFDIVQITVNCSDGLKVYLKAYKIPLICSPLSNQCIRLAVEEYPYLRNLPLADFADGSDELSVDLLIGSDNYWTFMEGPPIRGDGPTAIPTKLGYILNGPVRSRKGLRTVSQTNVQSVHVLKSEVIELDEDSISQDLSRFWDLEASGIRENESESSVHMKFLENVKFENGRYEVSLPMKECHPVIPDNFSLAKTRLISLLKRLKDQPSILEQYDSVIQEQLKAGVVEIVEDDDVSKPGEIHTLPHREVIREDKDTTKLRIVYDASSKRSGEASLNDCMHAGPSLTPHIFDIFLRFRLQRVALIGDLEKAFLNIGIKPEERDLLRFLWVDDIKSENPKLITLRFSRLVFGLVGSPFVLNATLRHHMEKYREIDPEFVDHVQNSTYVDDFASSVTTDEEAFELFQKLKSRFKEGGLYEICVKLTKRCLKKTLRNAKLKYEELETVLIETEGILNSRPLTYVHSELTETPLTPAHLICGRRLLDLYDVDSESENSSKEKVTKRAKYLMTVLEHFKRRWKTEYLTSIREKTREHGKPSNSNVKIGDIVHIFEDKIPRQFWRIGRIVKLLTGKDKIVRAVELITLDKAKEHYSIETSIKEAFSA